MENSETAAEIEFPASTGILPPSDPSPDGLRSWISETCRFLGLTPTVLAKFADLAPSTLNRFLRNLDEANLSARTIEALLETARKLEADPEFIAAKRSRLPEAEVAAPYLIDVAVMGPLAVDSFRPYQAWTQRIYRLRLPIRPPFHLAALGAFEVADDHAEPAFPKGSLVVVSPFSLIINPTLEPQDGDYVTMFRSGQGPARGTMECTVRRFVVSPGGAAWLVAINPKSGIEDVFLGEAATYRNREMNIHKRAHSLVIQSIRYHHTALSAN